MKSLSKVVWTEGMYLATHHFQAQNRYYEDLIHFSTANLWFEPYGFLACELDAEALRNGTVSLVHARGIFPDGLVFHMPESDPLPAARSVSEVFPPTQQHLRVDLAVPAYEPDGLNCTVTENGGQPRTRYIARPERLADENTGRDEKTLQLGMKNIQLRLETEPAEGSVTLQLARVARDGSGRFIYDPDFIPPCLDLAASEKLLTMIRKLVEDLEERNRSLSQGAKAGAKLASGLSARDVANFWYLHTLNTALAPLRHIYAARRGHPERAFLELARLAGALCTFKADSHPQSIPLYDHQNLERCFKALDEHIRTHLLTIFPENCVPIPLKPVAKYLYEGEIRDQRCLDRARWIFGVHAGIGEVELISLTPQLVKICSNQFVIELVKRALPGLALTHLPVPPAAVSPKVTNQYFSINLTGPCWEHIATTRRVGVYVPGEIPSPELELFVLVEG
ncbi:MAG: type VI secretion system baseplate subunit TssK [Terriglobia bacterium]